MNNLNLLPDFIIIGAMKAGTSSLYNYLSMHPEIEMSVKKETDYFTSKVYNQNKIDYYLNQFSDPKKVRGEASPNYSKFPEFDGVPEKMFNTIPDVKLIYLLRDPVERLLSQLHHSNITGKVTQKTTYCQINFENLEKNPAVLGSCYGFQIKQYLKYFKLEQILFIEMHELNKQEGLKKIFNFLGVDDKFYHKNYQDVHHQSSQKKVTRLGKLILKLKIYKIAKSIISNVLYAKIKKVFFKAQVKKPYVDEELKQKLHSLFSNDIIELENLTGQKFESLILKV